MRKHALFVGLGSALLSACVPGPELDRPAVEGIITDARTHRPVAGARVTLVKSEESHPAKVPWQKPQNPYSFSNDTVEEDAAVRSLPSVLSDARGRFSLEARYKFGIVLVYSDPISEPVYVHVTKDGYQPLDIRESYNLHVHPFNPIHEDAALEPVVPRPRKNTNL